MSDLAIRVEKLGKQYRIGARQPGYRTFREALTDGVTGPIKRLRGLSPAAQDQKIWALRDVSFEVKQGEVLGIIGRNGAGKSTLLKILSRITEPTEGCAELYGRAGSLLEVGTGFHPELTGRDNIYLNGAILGMKRSDIHRKFDEIVAFAEVEKFIDTPVKRYSSGMYMRLAFAVAAHLEPDILLIDEVLAVGDAAFQRKCLGKMREVAKEGRTVLFVSHNMGAMNSLTQRCLYIRDGQLAACSESRRVIEQYLMEAIEQRDSNVRTLDFYRRDFSLDSPVRITAIRVDDGSKEPSTIIMGAGFTIYVQVQIFEETHGANLTITLKNVHKEVVAILFSWDQGFSLSLQPGQHVVAARVTGLPLAPGQYLADVGVNQSTETVAYDVILDLPIFRIINNGQVTHWLERPWGMMHCNAITWQNME